MKAVIVLILVLFFMVGCIGSGPASPKFEDYKTGVKELKVVDSESSFPKLRHQNSRIKGTFRLHNQAAYDAAEIKVSLLGLDREYVKIEDTASVKKGIAEVGLVEGRGLTNDKGEIVDVEFEGFVSSLPPGTGSLFLNYFVNIKYSSKVEFSPTICVDSGLYNFGGCDGTNFENSKGNVRPQTYSGQGAPLAITYLEIIPYGSSDSEIEFRMTLRHIGGRYGKVGQIILNRASLTSNPLSCVFKGGDVEDSRSVLMPDAQEIDLICNGQIESQAPYKSPLYLEIFYEYELKMPRALELKGSASTSGGFSS